LLDSGTKPEVDSTTEGGKREGRKKQQEEEDMMGAKTDLHLNIILTFLRSAGELIPMQLNEEEKQEAEAEEERLRKSSESKGLPAFPKRRDHKEEKEEGGGGIDEGLKDKEFRRKAGEAVRALASWYLESSLDFLPATQTLVEVSLFPSSPPSYRLPFP
jgi:hypothetical protein